jgi:hypothetical protein
MQNLLARTSDDGNGAAEPYGPSLGGTLAASAVTGRGRSLKVSIRAPSIAIPAQLFMI